MSSTPYFDNIDQVIIGQLNEASYEIKAALAWFTDTDIIKTLEIKAEQGVRIDLILAQNEHNQEVNYARLIELGAQVLFIPPKGYGTMHNKFCVVDEFVVINGSYNWTVNAKKNNSENITVQKDKSVARGFLDQHDRLKKAVESGKPISEVELEPRIETQLSDAQNEFDVSFKNVLDTLISAEISQFNRDNIKQQGYESARHSNGDPQILSNSFDTLYSGFVNSIDIMDDRKKRLFSKIDEQKSKSLESIDGKYDIEVSQLRSSYKARENNINLDNTELETQVSLSESRVEKISEYDVKEIEKEKGGVQKEIDALNTEFIRPAFKWFDFIPTLIVNIGLLIYLFLFYSSAAYILLFSSSDAKQDRLNGVETSPPEVFNPDALSRASEKGSGAWLMLFLFVFIPITLSIVNRFLKSNEYFSKWPPGLLKIFTYLSFVLVDAFIAYSVTSSIHEVEYLTGTVDEVWRFNMVFSSPNFYLVFIMGALGLFLFDLAFEKLMSIFEERNPDVEEVRRGKVIELKQANIKDLSDKQNILREEIQTLKEGITTSTQNRIKNLKSIEQLHGEESMAIASVESKKQIQKESIQRITDIYKSHIENDNYLISMHAMKDRVNTFLDGWMQYLYEVYSVIKASGIIKESNVEAQKWYQNLNHTSKGFNVS